MLSLISVSSLISAANFSRSDKHNFFMQTAAEQGLIGLTALALLFMRGYWVAWCVYRQGRSKFHRGLGLGFLGCVTAVIITNIFGDRFSQFAIGGYFFIVFGLVERAWATCRVTSAVESARHADKGEASRPGVVSPAGTVERSKGIRSSSLA